MKDRRWCALTGSRYYKENVPSCHIFSIIFLYRISAALGFLPVKWCNKLCSNFILPFLECISLKIFFFWCAKPRLVNLWLWHPFTVCTCLRLYEIKWLWKRSHLETWNKELNYLDAVTGSAIGRSLMFATRAEQLSDCRFFSREKPVFQLRLQTGHLAIKVKILQQRHGYSRYKKRC